MLTLIIIIILILLLLGAVPYWPYNRGYGTVGTPDYYPGWGWGPGGFLGILLLVLLIYVLMGHRF